MFNTLFLSQSTVYNIERETMKTHWIKEKKKKKHWSGRDIGSNESSFIYQLCYFMWVQLAFWKGQWKVSSTSVIILMQTCGFMGFPSGSAGKESACNAGDLGSIPGLGRSPGEGKGYPVQDSGLENSMDCIDHGVAKSWTRLSDFQSWFVVLYNRKSVSFCCIFSPQSFQELPLLFFDQWFLTF